MAMRPPALVDDAMRAVFTRLPPDDPRSLVRAAAVCWSWRGILSDPGFARGYRAFHGAAPMLGFLHNAYRAGNRFVPTSTFRRRASQDRPDCQVLDSRHGLVLLYAPAYDPPLEARDLVTGNCWDIDADPKCHGIMHWLGDDPEDFFSGTAIHCNATVLCAKGRCDHLDCHGGPFLVALVGAVEEGGIALATVYSSETREWSDMISVQSPGLHIDDGGHTAVVGDMVYVPSYECDSVVEYNIREQQLSVINVPENQGQGFLYLIGVEDGMLLFASVLKPRLYLWSMEAGPRGAAAWARHRVVELEPLLPRRALLDMSSSDVWTAGFAEGVRVIFLRTPVGLHAIELNSGRVNKVHEQGIEKVMPYTSFCTGAWGRLPASNEASHAVVGGGTTV